MSCTTNQNKIEPVSIANGILPLANRMAGTLTSWNMWMDVKSPGDVVDKASSVLTGMTGVANPAGALYLGSDLLFWLRDRKNSQAEASPPEPELTPEQLDRMTRKKERIETVKQLFNVDDQEAERLADQYNPNKKEDDKAEMRETAEKQKERIKAIKQTLNIKSTEEAEALASKYGPPPKKEKPKPEPRSARYPKIVSPVGAMIALHTFEAATGTAGTAATRLFLPGKIG
jgi:hypothetical protein